jgi:hypothetical protein
MFDRRIVTRHSSMVDALVPLEILYRALMLLGSRERFEGTEIAALSRLRIYLAGMEPVLT